MVRKPKKEDVPSKTEPKWEREMEIDYGKDKPERAPIDRLFVLERTRLIIRFCKDGNPGAALAVARALEEYIDR